MTKKPLLFILLAIALGIVVGSYCFVYIPSLSVLLASLLLLLVASRFLSSLCLLPASFLLGMLLITNSIQRGSEPTVTIPILEQAEEYMSHQREQMLQTYRRVQLSDDVYGTVAAMTLGERSAVSPSLKKAYNISGASHVFALSGLHLSIIFMFLSLFLPTRLFPRISALLRLLLLWTFVLLVGIHPSILRAAMMFTIYSLCHVVSRSSRNIDVLILTALLLLVYNPQWLFDVGFQMSFMAMTGIFLLSDRLMRLAPASRYLWGMFVITLSANVGTAPLIALYFGRVSLYALLTNFIVSPCATLILFSAFLLQLSAAMQVHLPFLSPLTNLLVSLLKSVTNILNASVQWISTLPGASIDGISLSAMQTVLVYVIIIAVILIVRHIINFLRTFARTIQ